MKRTGRVIMLIAGVLGFNFSFAQTLAQHNWYFGNSNAAIRFNRTTNQASLVNNKFSPFGPGGSAVATDPATGNLLFYTDGNTIFDATNTAMPNGSGLIGAAGSNQPVAICAVPGQPNKYFVFTNTAAFPAGGTIRYSIVDMALFGNSLSPSPPFGDVMLGQKNLVFGVVNNWAEGMIIVPHSNGTDFWLITQQMNTTQFSATLINAASFAGTFVTNTFSIGSIPMSVANFAYSRKTNKLAVATQDPNTDAIIVNFNNALVPPGNPFSSDRTIFNTGRNTTSNQSIYDIEWDNSGQYLYISRTGEAGLPADVLQYDYVNSNPLIPTTVMTPLVSGSVSRSYGLQMAPDSAIYYLYQTAGGQFQVDKFLKTDTVASQVVRVSTPLGNQDFNGTQFPAFLPQAKPTINANFTFTGNCQNNATTFYPIISPNADSLKWDFGDGKDTVLWSPIHTYSQPNSYNVVLTAYFQGDSVKQTNPVLINPFGLQLQLVQDTTVCRESFPPPRGSNSPPIKTKVSVSGGTATSYNWFPVGNPARTTPFAKPDSAGYYYVVVSDGSSCSAYKGVNFKEHLLQDMRRNVWYFGNNAGIDFNQNPPVALSNSAMIAPEGCAVVCDRNGKAIFYTNGDQVFDRNDNQIDTGIGGDTGSTQSSIIIPVPGDETLYYVFTTQEIDPTTGFEARYSLFDLKLNNGNGAMAQKKVLLFSKSTERLTASTNFVIFHEYGNNTFRAYPVSASGIGDPVLTAIGSDHLLQFQGNAEGYMKLGPNGLLAVPLSNGSGNFIELFHFNDTTGVVSNFQRIDLNEPTGQIYGVEFSPGGKKLYITVTGATSKYIEYYIGSKQIAHFLQSVPEPAQLGAIQVAPNDQVFVAMNDPAHNTFLGTIQVDEDTTHVSPLLLNGFPLAPGTTSTLGLPNFRQIISNAFGGPDFTVTGLCLGDSTKFTGVGRDELDQFAWDFGDGAMLSLAANKQNPAHVYASPGTYTVVMTLKSKCPDGPITFSKQITINGKPPIPTINPPQSICHGSVTLDANAGVVSGLKYRWTTGDTTRKVVVTTQMFIGVTITNQFGCTRKDSTVVGDARPFVDLGPDQAVCQNTPVNRLDATNPPGSTYQWTINGAPSGVGATQVVDTSVPNATGTTYLYAVTVTFPNTCDATDQVAVTVNVSPDFTLSHMDPTGCGNADGSVTLQLNASAPAGGPLYSYFISGVGGYNQQGIDAAAPLTVPFTGLKAGQPVYSVVVQDQITGCTTSKFVGLSDAPFTANASAPPACDPVPATITTTATQFPLSYTITDNTTGAVTGPLPNATATINTNLNAGTYTIVVQDNAGCTQTINNLAIVANPPATITITPALCGSPMTLTASGSANYTWDPSPDITGPLNQPVVTLVPRLGFGTFTVHSSPPGPACPGTQTTNVDLQSISPAFTQSDKCSPPVVLTATPAGKFVYSWSLNGTPLATGGGQIVAGVSGAYTVTIFNPTTGCQLASTPTAVTVSEVLVPPTISVDPSPPCDDGTPFTLTATTTSTGVTYSWTLDGNSIAGATSANITQTSSGEYIVTISKAAACPPVSGEFPISRVPLPVGALEDRLIICNDPQNTDTTSNHVVLDPGKFQGYDWYKNQLNIGVTDQTLYVDSEGLYMVELTDNYGCKGTDQTQVDNLCIPKIVAPTAFRPGSSQSTNREFYVFSYFITDNFQIFIYNRWGEMIYQSSDRYFKWNGNLNNTGNPLPGGTYAYVIKYTSSFEPEKGVQEKHGGVVLLR